MQNKMIHKGMFALSGAIAGVISTLIFVIIHDIFISNIWFMLAPMLVAGALCGALLSWSYANLVKAATRWGWLGYNLVYVALFGFLGAVSVLIYEPVTTMAAVVNLNGPPSDLIDQATPMTAGFTLAMAVLITLIYGFNWRKFGAVLVTCIVLVVLLGLNVSTIGLVSIPSGSLYLIFEMFGLILVLTLVFALVFLVLEGKQLRLRGSVQ